MSNSRKATPEEIKAWLALMPEGWSLDDNVHSAWVIEDYITDCPGYAGPVGFILWSGSAQWVTSFEVSGVTVDGERFWKLGFDTCHMLESDPRGAFEEFILLAESIYGEETALMNALVNGGEMLDEEFQDTGSVTVEVAGRKFELVIHVKEVT